MFLHIHHLFAQIHVQQCNCTGVKPQKELCLLNKDHQRGMVDLMFLIDKSLRSFLTAVTSTAVALIAVIFSCIYLNLPGFIRVYLNLQEFNWIYLNLKGVFFWVFFWPTLIWLSPRPILNSWTPFSWNLLNLPKFTWIYHIYLILLHLSIFVLLYLILPFMNLPEFIWIYLTLPYFT